MKNSTHWWDRFGSIELIMLVLKKRISYKWVDKLLRTTLANFSPAELLSLVNKEGFMYTKVPLKSRPPVGGVAYYYEKSRTI